MNTRVAFDERANCERASSHQFSSVLVEETVVRSRRLQLANDINPPMLVTLASIVPEIWTKTEVEEIAAIWREVGREPAGSVLSEALIIEVSKWRDSDVLPYKWHHISGQVSPVCRVAPTWCMDNGILAGPTTRYVTPIGSDSYAIVPPIVVASSWFPRFGSLANDWLVSRSKSCRN